MRLVDRNEEVEIGNDIGGTTCNQRGLEQEHCAVGGLCAVVGILAEIHQHPHRIRKPVLVSPGKCQRQVMVFQATTGLVLGEAVARLPVTGSRVHEGRYPINSRIVTVCILVDRARHTIETNEESDIKVGDIEHSAIAAGDRERGT